MRGMKIASVVHRAYNSHLHLADSFLSMAVATVRWRFCTDGDLCDWIGERIDKAERARRVCSR